MTGEQRGHRSSASYLIRVRGRLGVTILRAFPALRAKTQDQDTLLQGVADQAALARLTDHGRGEGMPLVIAV